MIDMNDSFKNYITSLPKNFEKETLEKKATRAFNYFKKEIEDDLVVDRNVHVFKGNKIYRGDLKNGIPNGYGSMCYFSGMIYEGYWKEGKYDGMGTYTNFENSTAQIAKGNWINGECTYGTYIFANGDSYTGSWKDQKFHGQGKYKYVSGTILEGQWVNGEFENK